MTQRSSAAPVQERWPRQADYLIAQRRTTPAALLEYMHVCGYVAGMSAEEGGEYDSREERLRRVAERQRESRRVRGLDPPAFSSPRLHSLPRRILRGILERDPHELLNDAAVPSVMNVGGNLEELSVNDRIKVLMARERLSERQARDAFFRVQQLERELRCAKEDRLVPLSPTPETYAERWWCTECHELQNKPHTWRECAKNFEKERDALLDLAADYDSLRENEREDERELCEAAKDWRRTAEPYQRANSLGTLIDCLPAMSEEAEVWLAGYLWARIGAGRGGAERGLATPGNGRGAEARDGRAERSTG